VTAVLEAEGISKSYGGLKALNACSVSFTEGAINALIGPNGSGKTTLFNIMTGYERADSGAVRLRGRDITSATPDQVFRMGVGRSFQLTRVFPRLSVIENVHVASQRRGLAGQLRRWSSPGERRSARDVLDFVGLTRLEHEPAGSLSYGQQKLLEFAFGIVARPKVMLLDEPAGGVNPTLLRHLATRIRALNDEGVTFIIVEHDMEFVMGLAGNVVVMHQGARLASGPPAQVRANPDVLDAYLGGHAEGPGEC
jgi:ABC-type branched-subunit amino acid transport system ATPase component